MTNEIVMGIDTSNYTTSVGIVTLDGEIIANIKFPLSVKEGERGLRQSEALFSHVKNIPLAMEEARKYLIDKKLVAVGASERPRNVDGSYMPCFLAGIAARDSVSVSSDLKKYGFSHQCGHIMAVLHSSSMTELLDKRFVAFHVSGGTTEMLSVEGLGTHFKASVIGGTADLNAGQVIDRIGILLGCQFPAGREMEELALECRSKIPSKKPKLNDFYFNLSGLENLAIKLFEESKDRSLVAAFVFDYIGKALILACEKFEELNGKTKFVFAGGVMSNSIIKSMIKQRFDAYFAEPLLSADNAVGIALLTLNSYKSEKL